MVEVSSERSIGEKQSGLRSGPEEVTEAVKTSKAIDGWVWLISSLILIILLLQSFKSSSQLRVAGCTPQQSCDSLSAWLQ